MLVRFLYLFFLFSLVDASALVIDRQKTIKINHHNSNFDGNYSKASDLNAEQISRNLIEHYRSEDNDSYPQNHKSRYTGIKIDEEGRKNEKKSYDIKIKVTDPNSKSDNSALDFLHLAYKAFQDGKIDVALYYYNKAMHLKRNNVEAMFGVATCEQLKGNNDYAGELYLKILKIEPKNTEAINNLMIILADKDLNVAIKTLQDIRKTGDLDPVLYAQLGSLLARTGQYTKALQCLKIGLARVPNDALMNHNIAVVYDLLGDKKMALRYYQATLDNITLVDKKVISIATVNNRIKDLSQ